MLYNHDPSGGAVGSKDNLQSWNYAEHAVYMAAVAAHAKAQWNVSFSSVEAFNEPASAWWTARGSQEGCHFDPATQAAVAPLLRAEMDRLGLQQVRVSASDENSYDLALSTWRSFPAQAKAAVGQINVHGYQVRKSEEGRTDGREEGWKRGAREVEGGRGRERDKEKRQKQREGER